MAIGWRAAADTFERILRKHHAAPASVTGVEAAWCAFVDFLQTEIGGIAPAEEDGDGFVVQWGRRTWGDGRPVLTLTRQLTVVDVGDRADPDWQEQLWQVGLEIVFDDESALIALEPGPRGDTGFRFDPIGPRRGAALAKARALAQQHVLVQAMWRETPANSELTFECLC
ncbi:MAG: hypothetical protein ABIQ18_18865 [Umezawaea sp.]